MGSFSVLPNELLLQVCAYLYIFPPDIVSLSRVCKKLYFLLGEENDLFWRSISTNWWKKRQRDCMDVLGHTLPPLDTFAESLTSVWKGWKWFLSCFYSQKAELEVAKMLERIGRYCTFMTIDWNLNEGETWYILPKSWWHRWIEASKRTHSHKALQMIVGQINNAPLVAKYHPSLSFCELNPNIPFSELVAVSSTLWYLFLAKYGGGPTISRKVYKNWIGWKQIEIHPLLLWITTNPMAQFKLHPQEFSAALFSSADSVGYLKATMCEKFGLDPLSVDVYDFHRNTKFKQLTEMNRALRQYQIVPGQTILVEQNLYQPMSDD